MKGVSFPLVSKNTEQVFEFSQTRFQQLVSGVKMLMLTQKGERVGRPQFGTGLMDYLFSPISPTTATRLKQSIEQDISLWIPEVSAEVEVVTHLDIPALATGEMKIRLNLTFKDETEELIVTASAKNGIAFS